MCNFDILIIFGGWPSKAKVTVIAFQYVTTYLQYITSIIILHIYAI